MKFELNRPADLSDTSIIGEIIRVSQIVEKPLTKKKFSLNSKYSVSTIEKRFGGWIAALEKAGLDKSYWHLTNVKVSSEEIILELIRVSELLKTKAFTREEFATISGMSKHIFFHGDNSFNKLMRLAGLEVPLKSKRYTDIDCFENLLSVWTFYGRQPNYSEMKSFPSVVGPKAYVLRWGSWTKALFAFISKVNEDGLEPDTSLKTDNIEDTLRVIKKKTLPEDRREVPLGLRFKILQRDRYKCVICGRSPATTLSIILHVDHIMPFSKGGKTLAENLRTLCNECNSGKADIIE